VQVNILDAVPLHSERLGNIDLSTLGRLGDLEGYQKLLDRVLCGTDHVNIPATVRARGKARARERRILTINESMGD
jgi:hypothetical protein